MRTSSFWVIGFVAAIVVPACGGSVVTIDGSSSGSSGSSSGSSGSSSGSSGASSSSSSGSSGTSSSSSSGGTCKEGSLGDLCPWPCPNGPRAVCTGGKYICPAPPPGPNCGNCVGPIPDCTCGTAQCIASKWTCSSCGPFMCGSMTCVAGQMCTDTPPGIVLPDGGTPSDSLECAPIPPACVQNPSCACVAPALKSGGVCSPSSCTDDGNGRVTVYCIGA